MRLLATGLLVLLGFGQPAVARSREGPVRLGQTARVGGPLVRPEQLIEDSRCPMNARCIWAGRVVVRTRITTGVGTYRRALILGEPVRVADGELTLMAVTPDRFTGRKLKPSQLRFAFEFHGGI